MKPTLTLWPLLLLVLFFHFCKANSLYQTFFNTLEHHRLESDMLVQLNTLINPEDPEDNKKKCNSCISLLKVTKQLCRLPESIQLAAMIKVCKDADIVDDQVCEGMVREQGPIIRRVLRTMDVGGRDGHLACASVLNACPYPEIDPWKVPFPKPKPKYTYRPKRSNKTISVIHLSDWHVDPQYQEGSETECNKPICCRKEYTDYQNVTSKASPWGSFNCDSPISLIESMLNYIPKISPNTSFGILTGDIPPHEVWETLPIKKTQMIQKASYMLLHSYFDSPFFNHAKLYPAIGNHEAAPTNLFPLRDSNLPRDDPRRHELSMEWLYATLQSSWEGWLPPQHLPSVHKNTGSYVSHPYPGLKLISINTNFCYNLNWWLYEQPTRRDPNGVLTWLVSQLQKSEDAQERVWIIGHTPPGDDSCFHDYSNYYYQIVERYAPHVIAGQFFGHTHRDEIQLFYRHNATQKANDAISIGYLAPSITPFPDMNPGFRTYTVDTGTFEVVDSHTYIADLEQSTDWQHEPNWHREYSAKEYYGSTNNTYAPLSPAWWHQFTEEMARDDKKFDLYWLHRYKSSPLSPPCDHQCRINAVCNIRAGKSELRCDYEPSESTPRAVILDRKDKNACGLQLLKREQKV